MNLLDSIDQSNLPKHLAIIMDGNGRWAKQQGFLRAFGHENGTKSVKKTITTCAKLGIEYLTLYAFSTENWNRPKLEVEALMKILINSLKKELVTLQENNIRLNAIGNLDKLPKTAQKELLDVIDKTKNNTRLTLTLALSYGSREELVNAVRAISDKVKNNIISIDTIDDSIINEHLYTQNLPDVDLLIRTSGEHRISNFLLWQIAYAELYFTNVLWPDFKDQDLYEAIISYQKRERRFGKTSEQIK
ncbi:MULTISPECIES: isoprenyl transferase [Flavobacterium]|jgi:undecaprenyl diphosphate synthase|uniref:Isoprenyl transferase n=1 Tax=Flavobacterium johnsoniae (strain ATCC 17061 / DSM 2064 / JCM 8514 / BCRC 14874 / CCUG 350202 / NBRC 14942 / NCIMB 11054 / UW101) TaxID=376686 RepID=A5FJ91_FLAJ1|nr:MULTISPECIES: isoprenyl transferase [Flavobacterium]ABQ04723.1 undecaprenyl diphosphate synthase [Flavobacterium johnsoniae UW101]OXE96476.1 di-trans,poly-cis-decaprenylcistransferase [Flavobacterium johnsoniae UW101]WDF60434.1 isoprenyl transferase [Flavobacterium sp. KACC 22758]WQG83479.1 isoprenyl transferase [Flavobacterium johnsoniae UW101]SHK31618.1 undecaprenyl diphosphate synthase [Flavobacterium johnsoniae]